MKKKKSFENGKYKNNKIYIIIFVIILPLIAGCYPIYNLIKDLTISNSDLEIDLIESKYYGSLSGEQEVRLGVLNKTNDAKPITKALLKVTEIEEVSSINMNIVRIAEGDTVFLKVYNSGWETLNNISFMVTPDSDFYNVLLNPHKFRKQLSIMNPGQLYDLFTITKDELKNDTLLLDFQYNYNIDYMLENNTSPISCSEITYAYNEAFDTIIIPGKGGGTETYPLSCCIETQNGIHDYELPIAYTCNAHHYEEIKLILTANKSCKITYSIEFYSNEKCLFKSPAAEIEIKIDSHNGPPDIFQNNQ